MWTMMTMNNTEVIKRFSNVDDATLITFDMVQNCEIKIEYVNQPERIIWVTLIED